jgi:16S rRNA (guanine966-N2)-methyltransferase
LLLGSIVLLHHAMRIIAGRFKGRSLAAPKSDSVRPTSDRLRETIFNILTHGHGGCQDALVLDLFAGTGALGFEALSRGARFAAFVDQGAEARGLIRANIEALGLGGETRLLKRDATDLGAISTFQPFTLVFADPPYGKGLGEAALASALAGGWIAKNATIVLEERNGQAIALPAAFEIHDERQAGEGQILILRLAGGKEPD